MILLRDLASLAPDALMMAASSFSACDASFSLFDCTGDTVVRDAATEPFTVLTIRESISLSNWLFAHSCLELAGDSNCFPYLVPSASPLCSR